MAACAVLVLLSGCGYHTAGHANALPEGLHSIAVPAFENKTHAYRVEQMLTSAVVRELITRTKYSIAQTHAENADAVLHGTVLAINASPLTFDNQTGRASSVLVTMNVAVKLVTRNGNVLYENPNYTFRDQYQVSREITSFFEEDSPAVARMSRDFAATLVSDARSFHLTITLSVYVNDALHFRKGWCQSTERCLM